MGMALNKIPIDVKIFGKSFLNMQKMTLILLVLLNSIAALADFKSYLPKKIAGYMGRSNKPYCEQFDLSKSVHLDKNKLLILMTHPQLNNYDVNASTYSGISSAYEWLDRFENQSVILVENENSSGYFVPTCQPEAFYLSVGGEFNFDISTDTIVSMGGFLSACLSQSIEDVLKNWLPLNENKNVKIIFPMEAIYENPITNEKNRYDLSYENQLNAYFQITGTTTMNLVQVARLMGKELFVKKISTLFSKEGAIVHGLSGPNDRKIKFNFPSQYSVELSILKRAPVEIIYKSIIKNAGENSPKIELNFVDQTYLISATSHLKLKKSRMPIKYQER